MSCLKGFHCDPNVLDIIKHSLCNGLKASKPISNWAKWLAIIYLICVNSSRMIDCTFGKAGNGGASSHPLSNWANWAKLVLVV